MITPKIKALFQFIEFLHSNIDNFKKHDEVLNELHLLHKERQKVRTSNNFADKLKYDELQDQIKNKFKVILENILTPIKAKAIELNVCDFSDNRNAELGSWRGIFLREIEELKNNFSKDDLPRIFSYKSKYLEYRKATKGESFFGLGFFFDDLDELLKNLFNFFDDTEKNEFESFETKAIPVNSISEAIQGFKQGKTKFIVPSPISEAQMRIQEQLAAFNFFQVDVIADLRFEGETYKEVKQRNNNSILTLDNWERHKEKFFTQRIAAHKQSYTLAEKIKLELSALEKLPINNTDYLILKERYQAYLEQKQALPPQPNVKRKTEQETPKTFDELFYNTDLVEPCIDILKELDPPLIDTDCNFIGKLKGVFCIWIDEMQRQGIVKSNYPEERKLFALLITQKIKRFSIDESMFGKYQSRAEKNYRTDIKTKISKIKLSQNSQ